MGIVYRGVQPVIGKEVAIKVLRPEIAADPEQVRRLLEEARAINAIRSRSIVDVFGFGQLSSGQHYIAMEYLRGRPLDSVIHERAPLPAHEVLQLLDEVLAGLSAAHGAGVIHRDLKPSNIFLVTGSDTERYVKLLDFGLAKRPAASDDTLPQTRTGAVVGTPEYMAPEQAMGKPISPRTDLYALGVVAFEMLTGQLPFQDDSALKVMMKHVSEAPPAPSSLVRDLPEGLSALVLQLLSKAPEDRPPSAEGTRLLVSRLRRQLSQAETRISAEKPAPPTGPASMEPRAAQSPGTASDPSSHLRRAHRTAVTAAVLLGASAAGGVAAWYKVRSEEPKPPGTVTSTAPTGAPALPGEPKLSASPPPIAATAPEESSGSAGRPSANSPRREAAEARASAHAARRQVLRRIQSLNGKLRTAALDGKADPLATALLQKLRDDARSAQDLDSVQLVSRRLDEWERQFLGKR
ncbi:MAG: protein kinase [Myxococcales bacterium]|nr:protein kinase [Myxococcales bacterium]